MAMVAGKNLELVVRQLEKYYGRPAPPGLTDPFEMILWEQVAYLVNDARRAEAFALLRRKVGLLPTQITAAPEALLAEITAAGGRIAVTERAGRLRRSAQLVVKNWGGDLRNALRLPLEKAKKALMQFPMIGEPGAEKILLFTRSYPVFALDSNGLRVLLRLGYGEHFKNYLGTYRSVQQAVAGELRQDFPWLIEAHQLLRRHGQESCKRNAPRCGLCPLQSGCAYLPGP